MLNTRFYCVALAYAACTLFALGCNNASPTPVPSPPSASHADEDAHDHSGHDHGDHAHAAGDVR